MVRGQSNKRSTEYLSPSELRSLEEEKQELEASVREIEDGSGTGTRGSNVDVGSLKRNIAQLAQAIAERTPDKPKPLDRDKLSKEEKDIEDKLSLGMPTRYEMNYPHRCPGAVRKHMAWCRRNQGLIDRYVKIQRVLRPEEPKSVETLRKDK